MTIHFTALVGKRVRNNGDIRNAPRDGIITDLKTDRWGTFAVILWDEDEHIGWHDDGEATIVNEPVSVIPTHSIETAGKRSRFTLIAA